ncbi:MAG: hypothetical protein ATN35_09715 [Epulopiscium sp. Nele67-Bin004]|nr:MAG: hypothetical protein ATN35_09715 [Epulopiscium sp. Nele67-Bin004]
MQNITVEEWNSLVKECNGDEQKATECLDSYITALASGVLASEAITTSIKNAGLYNKMANNLSHYNTMRGGTKGFKGFVFEELHATQATINGQATQVIANNGIADFYILDADGGTTLAQAKVGYKTGKVDWDAYGDQTIVIDKGNQQLIDSAKAAGKNVIESDISAKQAEALSKAMQMETKITGKPNSTIVTKGYSTAKTVGQAHNAGIQAGIKGAQFGAGMSIGANIVDVANGDKEFSEAAEDVAVDTVVSGATSYAVGAASSIVGSTAVGAKAIGAASGAVSGVSSVATGAATMAANSAVGSAAIGAASATTAAVTGAATAATTAITSTAVGGAVAGAATAAGAVATGAATATVAAIGSTAVGATALAAAPVVVTGAVIGGIAKGISGWFR